MANKEAKYFIYTYGWNSSEHDSQRSICTDFAELESCHTPEVFSDDASPLAGGERHYLSQLISTLLQEKYSSHLLVTRFSLLGPNLTAADKLLRLLWSHGVRVVFTESPVVDSKKFADFDEAIVELATTRPLDLTVSQSEDSEARRTIESFAPYCFGYCFSISPNCCFTPSRRYRDEVRYQVLVSIAPEAAATIRLIFDLLRDGHSTLIVARLLNDWAVPCPGGHFGDQSQHWWNADLIERIATNPIYTGQVTLSHTIPYGNETGKVQRQSVGLAVPNLCIVSAQLWDDVQRRLHSKGHF